VWLRYYPFLLCKGKESCKEGSHIAGNNMNKGRYYGDNIMGIHIIDE